MTTSELPANIPVKKRGRKKGQKIEPKSSQNYRNAISDMKLLSYIELEELSKAISKRITDMKQSEIERLETKLQQLKASL